MRRALDRFCLILGGHIFFQTLSAAVQLDLFTLLSRRGPMTLDDIAEALKIEKKPARILLLGCAALGLLRKEGDRYSDTFLSKALLGADAPRNVIPIVEWQHFINYRALYHFHDAIKANANVGLGVFAGDEPHLYGRLTHEPRLEQIFQRAMQSISVQANRQLVEYVDFSAVRKLVDVGGGNGSNIMALARRYPELRAVVFDSPSVCRIAEEHIAREGLSDRLGAVAGDCFRDPLPRDADCILFCHFFTIWSEERNRELLKRSFDALPEGGSVIVFNMMQSDDEAGPLTAALGSPYFLTLATGEGMLYTWREYERWMMDAGFTRVVRRALVRNHGVIIGVK
jgi:ubiquinone/menaquinone biosynthesis C-methylase UbiE